MDAFIHCHDPAYYAQFRGRNAFLVHFLDETYEGGYELIQQLSRRASLFLVEYF